MVATAVAGANQPIATPTPEGITAEDIQRIVAAALSLPSDPKSTALKQVYEAPSGRWSIQHPDGWSTRIVDVAYSEKIQLAGVLTGTRDPAPVVVEVERVNDGGLLPLDASTDAVILLNLGILEDFQLLSRSTQAFLDTFVEELVISHDAPLGPYIILMIVLRSTSDLYTIQGVTMSSSFEDVEEQIREIVYSFRTLTN